MRYEYKASFDRAFRKLPKTRRTTAASAIEAVVDFFETGTKPKGLGLKQLRKPYWEIRTSLKDRVIFAFEGDLVSFLLVGSHDDIRRYLTKKYR